VPPVQLIENNFKKFIIYARLHLWQQWVMVRLTNDLQLISKTGDANGHQVESVANITIFA